jgi:hypothetical protein
VVSPRRQALYRSLREIALERSITRSPLDAALAGGVAR